MSKKRKQKQKKHAQFDTERIFKQAYDSYMNTHNPVQRTAPVPENAETCAMDGLTMNGVLPGVGMSQTTVNPRTMLYYAASSSFIGYYACMVMAQHWLVNKCCSYLVKAAVAHGWKITTNSGEGLDPQVTKTIEAYNKAYHLKENMIEAETFKNIFGIRLILFKNINPEFDYSKPFNPDGWSIGDYAGMSQIDPYWCTPEFIDEDLSDPTRINYYEPTYWQINGKRYHKSHFVVLKGAQVADYLKATYRYGGIPKVQEVYERVYAAESTANEAPALAKNKRLTVQKVNLEDWKGDERGLIQRMNNFARFRDNYGIKVIGLEDEISQIDTTLTDFSDLITDQYQLVCATFGVPASKILGTGHMGFSTGETDDDYWIEECEELQGNSLDLIMHEHYRRMLPSISDRVDRDLSLDAEWNKIKVLSDSDIADIRQKMGNYYSAIYQTGAVTNIQIAEALAKDPYSGFEGMQVEEITGNEDDEDLDDDDDDDAMDGMTFKEVGGKLYIVDANGDKVECTPFDSVGEAAYRLGQLHWYHQNAKN